MVTSTVPTPTSVLGWRVSWHNLSPVQEMIENAHSLGKQTEAQEEDFTVCVCGVCVCVGEQSQHYPSLHLLSFSDNGLVS